MNITGNYPQSVAKRHLNIRLGKMLQPAAKSDDDELLPYLRAANVTWGAVDHSDTKEMWFSPDDREKYGVSNGDLLVLEGGDVGRAAIASDVGQFLGIQNSLHRVRPKKGNEIRFAYYWMQHLSAFGYFDLVCSKATLAHFTSEKFAVTPYPQVDVADQKQIADFLDRETALIDQLIEKKQRSVALMREQRDAYAASLLTDPASTHDVDEEESDWRYPAPDGWIVRPIRSLCSIYGRIGFRGYTTEDIVDEGDGAISLSPSNISDGTLKLGESTYISWEKYVESPEIQVKPNDILFVKTGSTIGKTALVPDVHEPMTLNPQLVVLKEHKIDSAFLWLSMLAKPFQYQVSWNKFGGSTPAMSQGHLGRLRLAFPEDPQTQRQLASQILSNRHRADEVTSKVSASIDALSELRSALITAAVTGQIDVTTWGKQGQTDRRLDKIQEEMGA